VAECEACLVDVYDTLLRSDFAAYMTELPRLAGITTEAWADGYRREVGLAFRLGQMSKAEGFARILRAVGAEPRPDLVRALVDLDLQVLMRNARLYDDALPFLRALRASGIKIAIVSNCSEHTRDLLEANGVAALADTLVLSYEVGAEKPAAEIFIVALDRLGVAARNALFVDDQPSYCAAAAALGITAVQIVRGEPDGKVPAAGTMVVRSLTEVEAMLTGSAPGRTPETGRRRTS
jgi:putative hydrolase of the HAD superfamily